MGLKLGELSHVMGASVLLVALVAIQPSGARGVKGPVTDGAVIRGHHLEPSVVASLHRAAEKTGVDFEFLAAQASLESGFRRGAQAHGTSATGLFQFTSATWLRLMRAHGGEYGYGALTRRIKMQSDGKPVVASPQVAKQILDLRRNVGLCALIAGEYAKSNAALLETSLGRKASPTDLHLAHLLGPAGAIRFLKAQARDNRQVAAKVSPAAARENPALFYAKKSQSPQSIDVVYHKIQNRLEAPMKEAAALTPQEALRQALGLIGQLLNPRARAG